MCVRADPEQHQLEADRAGPTANVLELALVLERRLLVSALAEDAAAVPEFPASLLKEHVEEITVLLDEDAASRL